MAKERRSLSGKVVAITGGARGIGKATASALIAKGCRVAIGDLTPALIEAAHRAGKKVHIWTVDDSEIMERLIDAGVDGIFTDRVDTLKDVLVRRGLWA